MSFSLHFGAEPGSPYNTPSAHQQPVAGQPVAVPSTDGITAALHRLAPMESIMPLLKPLGRLVRHLTLDDAADLAMQALDIIGNLYYGQYLVELLPLADGTLDLPDNCEGIDYLVAPQHHHVGRTATSLDEQLWTSALSFRPSTASADPHPDAPRQWVSYPGAWQQLQQRWGQPLAASVEPGAGPLRLRVAPGTGPVLLSYQARFTDDRGWVLVTPKEALACAHYCRFVVASEKFMAKELTYDQYKVAKDEWEARISPARNEGLGDKQGLAKLLNQHTSFHRHLYGSRIPL
jgi:hypothetical protein